ncbi:GNAT family N-acetyltransferase [Roseomonas sp. BN140053]|uniref:GNAT family N-acetyltransferase n=1 Tax=Roseomonas sp. BN140053 TaxID=3391898 RepID=UPI0039ED798A
MSRITLHPVRWTDGPELIQANRDSCGHHTPWVQPFTDAAGFADWFGRHLTGPHRSFVARDAADGAVAGMVNLSEIVWGSFRSAYLGYYGSAAAAGRGLMTEAVGAAARHAFAELGLHRLEANVQPGNLRSLALLRRLGFRQEGFSPGYLRVGGEWRDHERWALLATLE